MTSLIFIISIIILFIIVYFLGIYFTTGHYWVTRCIHCKRINLMSESSTFHGQANAFNHVCKCGSTSYETHMEYWEHGKKQ